MKIYRSYFMLLVAVILVTSVTGTTARAATYQWVNPNGGSWVTNGNWNPSGYPRFAFDFAIFNLQATYDVDATNSALIQGLGGIQVNNGNVSLSTHDSFRAILGIGTPTSGPAVLALSSGAVTATGTHTIRPNGTLVMEPGSRLESLSTGNIGFAIEAGGTLRGDGGALEHHVLRSFGTVSPGMAPGMPGMILIGSVSPGGYIQRETGVLDIEIGGLSPGTGHDQLRMVNTVADVALDGTLMVSLIGNFLPSSDARFDVLTAPSIIGTFATEILPSVPGFEFSVAYEPTKVTVVATRLAPAPTYALDIKPASCPNRVNIGKNGTIPAALLGAQDLDVHAIDPSTLRLEGISPERWSFEDVSAPFDGDLCGCSAEGPDGFEDMTLKFKARDLLNAVGPALHAWEERILTLTGNLLTGEPFEASDCITVRNGPAEGPFKVSLQTSAWEPVQRVSYELPDAGEVRLGVYSPAGRKVAEIVRTVQPAGGHTVEWNAGRFPSGIYFYRLESGVLAESTRLMLIR